MEVSNYPTFVKRLFLLEIFNAKQRNKGEAPYPDVFFPYLLQAGRNCLGLGSGGKIDTVTSRTRPLWADPRGPVRSRPKKIGSSKKTGRSPNRPSLQKAARDPRLPPVVFVSLSILKATGAAAAATSHGRSLRRRRVALPCPVTLLLSPVQSIWIMDARVKSYAR
jgi:hypothetical protein